jgi:AcrR family transcriptional regulator
VTTTRPRPALRSPADARQRVLQAAAELFASQGIRAVGIDRVISRASVTKATLYKHFGSNDRVVCEYLSAVAQEHYTTLERIMADAATPRAALAALADALLDPTVPDGTSCDRAAPWPSKPGFRGLLFVNAAIEFTDPAHPVRIIIASRYSVLTQQLHGLVRQLDHARPADAIDDLMITYIGALTWGSIAGLSAATPSTASLLDAAQACRRGFDRVCDEALLPSARAVELSE